MKRDQIAGDRKVILFGAFNLKVSQCQKFSKINSIYMAGARNTRLKNILKHAYRKNQNMKKLL